LERKVQGLPKKNTIQGMWVGRRGAMPTRGASAWQGWPCLRETLRQAGFFYEQAPLKKRDKLPEPLRLSIPHARNFVLCLSIICSTTF
jgi:hypothetical protein